jgi:hypothetical protein
MQLAEQQSANSEMQQPKQARRLVGRPFPKGTSGNPHGRPPSARRKWLRAGLAEALGGLERLTVDQRTLLDLVVEQTLLVEKSQGSERTRAANVLLRLRTHLGLDARSRRAEPPAESYAQLAARVAAEQGAEREAELAEDEAEAAEEMVAASAEESPA